MSDLRRSIGPVRATAMVVGTIIGASIFVQPSVITGEMRSVAGVVLVWALAGGLTLAGALICAELASAYPLSGGVYVFLREAYSPALGFLWGWAMFWSMHSGIIAAIAMVFSRYVAYFVPLGDAGLKAVAIGAVLLLSAVNYLGVAFGSAVQAGVTIRQGPARPAVGGGRFLRGARRGGRRPGRRLAVRRPGGDRSPRASRLCLDGARRAAVPVAGSGASPLRHAAPGDCPPGGVVVSAGGAVELPRLVHPSRLYG